MNRVISYLRGHGLKKFLIRLYQKFWPLQQSCVYSIRRPSEFEPIKDLRIERYKSFEEMDSELLDHLRREGSQHLQSFGKLFQHGSEVWLGLSPGGRLAGVCASTRDRARDNYFVPIRREEATIFGCWVLEPFRGRGIYPSMLKEIVNTYLKSGVTRIYIDCKKWNYGSIRGIEKAGFEHLGSAWRLKIRSRSIIFAESWRHRKDSRRTPYGRRGLGVRIAYLIGAILWWIVSGFGRFGRRGAVVLCYHAVLPGQEWDFCRQMRALQNRAVRSDQLPTGGIRWGSPLHVCVTFDDAFVCLREHALPALKESRIGATVFVPVENLGRTPRWAMPEGHPESQERVCSESELTALAQEACLTIGSHSCTHPDLTQIDNESVRTELEESKRKLEALLGKEVYDFALPHGRYNDSVLALAKQAGYSRVFTLEPRVVRQNEGVLGRFLVSPDMWGIEFKLTAAGAYQWLYLLRKCVYFSGVKKKVSRKHENYLSFRKTGHGTVAKSGR